MIKNFFQNQWFRVVITLSAIIVAIVLINPLSTPCQSEVKQFQDSTQGIGKKYRPAIKRCQDDPSIGGCTEFLEFVTQFNRKVKDVGNQCTPGLKDLTSVQVIIPNSLEMFVRAAWGSLPPSASQKNGFFETGHLMQFCRLKQFQISIFGEQAWNGLVNRLLEDLPQASSLNRNDAWSRTIMSDPCRYQD